MAYVEYQVTNLKELKEVIKSIETWATGLHGVPVEDRHIRVEGVNWTHVNLTLREENDGARTGYTLTVSA